MNRNTVLASVVLLALLTSSVAAQPNIWLGTVDNFWGNQFNWSDMVLPTLLQEVRIDQEAPNQAIAITGGLEGGIIRVGELMAGQLDILTGGDIVAERGFVVGANSGVTGTLNVSGLAMGFGVDPNGVDLFLGQAPGSTGELNLSQGGVFVGQIVRVGDLGQGTVNFVDDPILDVGILVVGNSGSSSGTVNQLTGNVITASDYILGADGNAMGIVNQFGGTTTIGGNLVLTGSSIGSSALYNLNGGVLDLMGGDIVFNQGIADFTHTDGILRNVGTFGGPLEQSNGTLSPGDGDGVGTLEIQGDFTQGVAATFQVDVDGASNTTDFINVQGAALLQGRVEPVVLSRFDTVGDHMQTVLTAAGGITETPPEPVLDPQLEYPEVGHIALGVFLRDFMIVGSSVVANYFQAIGGDTDGDSDVDVTDFNMLAANFDPTGANINHWPEADFDENNTVDITDFNNLALHFTPMGYAGQGAVVPEPASWLLALAALACFAARWVRQMNRTAALTSVALVILLTSPLTAQILMWDNGGNTNGWEDSINWDPNMVPTPATDVIIDQEPPTSPVVTTPGQTAAIVTIGASMPGELEIGPSPMELLAAEQFIVGANADGKLNAMGGVTTTDPNSLILGQAPGSFGELDLRVFGSFTGVTARVGELGLGRVTMTDAAVLDLNTLVVGDSGSSVGTIDQTLGSIITSQDYILGRQSSATGIVNQSGGTTTVGGDLVLTDTSATSSATYNLVDGVLDLTGGSILFNSGTANFNYTGGTLRNVGTYGAALVQSDGTLSPGDGIGTMVIQGIFDQGEEATYVVEIDGATNTNDLIDVQGQAVLRGHVELVVRSRCRVAV